MRPFLKPGDYVFVLKTRRVKPGDVILCYHPLTKRKMIKRVKEINADGTLTIIGDNPSRSTDSRHFGPIGVDDIIGKVVWVIRR